MAFYRDRQRFTLTRRILALAALIVITTGCSQSTKSDDGDKSDGGSKGSVKFQKNDKGKVVGASVQKLPVTADAVKDFKKHDGIASVLFYECKTIEAAAIGELIKLPRLATVEFVRCKVSDDALKALARSEQLTELQFGETELTADQLAIFKDSPQLATLTLKGKSCLPAVLPGLAGFGKLRTLYLDLKEANLAKVPQLKSLSALRLLKIPNGTITDADLAALPPLPKLEEFEFVTEKITGAGLEHLAKQPSLKRLSVSNSKIEGKDLVHLRKFQSLEVLDISGCKDVTNKSVPHLLACNRLRKLVMIQNGMTGAALKELIPMKSLKHCVLTNLQATSAQAKAFRAARPDCRLDVLVVPAPPGGE